MGNQLTWPPITTTAGPIQYIKDGINTVVSKDTGTPSNSTPIPVEITGAAGPINITAGDLNVQLTDLGANADAVRIGDGTNRLGITPASEAMVSVASLPLPLGAATEATLATLATEATLSALNAKFNTLGQQPMASSQPIVIASDQSPIPASQSGLWNIQDITGTVSLPTGAATEATLSAMSGKLNHGAATIANSVPVNIASDQVVPVSFASSPLPTGAATEATLGAINTKLVADFGVSSTAMRVAALIGNTSGSADFGAGATSAQTQRVVVANDQVLNTKVSGKTCIARARNDYSSVNVTTGAYVQLIANIGATPSVSVEIFDSSGQTLVLATGGAGSEVDQVYITPGGNGAIPLIIAAGTRVSVKAVSALASAGEITINIYG